MNWEHFKLGEFIDICHKYLTTEAHFSDGCADTIIDEAFIGYYEHIKEDKLKYNKYGLAWFIYNSVDWLVEGLIEDIYLFDGTYVEKKTILPEPPPMPHGYLGKWNGKS